MEIIFVSNRTLSSALVKIIFHYFQGLAYKQGNWSDKYNYRNFTLVRKKNGNIFWRKKFNKICFIKEKKGIVKAK